MAMVLDAFASYLGDLLKQVAGDELGMMLGVSGDIDKMGLKLDDLKNFLTDAERRRITDVSVQAWVAELKRAMYEATDILDLCQLKIMERGSSVPDVGCCNPLLFCLRNPRFAHEIGGRIKKLNQTLDSIKERSAAFSFLNISSYEDQRMARPTAYRKTDPVLERSGVVGEKIEDDTRALVEKLCNKNGIDDIMVVAIVGVGGIGKTTLAKKVFNDEAIQGKFAKKIWLSITQEFNEVELLRTAIVAIDGDLPKLGGGRGEEALLVPALASAIRDKKFFLVLDDMWGNTAWNNLLKAPFSHGAPGSRVLITTRHDTVARGMKAVHPYHRVDKLEDQDAWSLLKKQRVVSAAKLRRSARIADREAPFYSTMAQKASRLKAARFDLLAASDDLAAAVQGSSICNSDDDASDADDAAEKLAQIALICGADDDEADAVRAAGALPSP